jgi:hypothetical protein
LRVADIPIVKVVHINRQQKRHTRRKTGDKGKADDNKRVHDAPPKQLPGKPDGGRFSTSKGARPQQLFANFMATISMS